MEMIGKVRRMKLREQLSNSEIANPGRITGRALRDKYAGLNGKLAASESEVKRTLQRLLDEGNLISRSPTDQERKLHRLSHNVKEILDLPEVAC